MDVLPGVCPEGKGNEEVQDCLGGCSPVTTHKVGVVAICCAVVVGVGCGYEFSEELYAERDAVLYEE